MCGIGGWISGRGLADGEALGLAERLTARIRMRGPDGEGRWSTPDRSTGFVHTRLAIIDPTPQSDQPFIDSASGAALTYNGEIYNFRELREALRAAGVEFRTAGDAEVVLRGYLHQGIDFFARLRGMFAFALHDPRSQTVVAMRDPLGIKPLYKGASAESVVFSSSPTAVAEALGDMEPDPAAAVSLAIMGCTLEPLTRWRGVSALEPGVAHVWSRSDHSLVERRVRIDPQFDWTAPSGPGQLDHLDTAFSDSIRAHFTSDVPVAIFQSGGLDSALIATTARRLGFEPTLLTIGFEEFRSGPLDEVAPAAEIAQRLNLPHRVSWVSREAFVELRDRFFTEMESPTADAVNTYLVSALCRREGFKVALSGVGGDELFAGYPAFHQMPKLAPLLAAGRLPLARHAFGAAFRTAAALKPGTSPKLKHAGGYFDSFERLYLLRRAYFAPEEAPSLLDRDVVRAGLERFWSAFEQQAASATGTDAAAVRTLERDVYMRNVLLKDADWAGMAHGVEIRTPFVDVPFQRAVCDPKDRCTFSKDDLRVLLTRAMGEIPARRKVGFVVPHHLWSAPAGHAGSDPLTAGSWGPRAWNREVLKRCYPEWAI